MKKLLCLLCAFTILVGCVAAASAGYALFALQSGGDAEAVKAMVDVLSEGIAQPDGADPLRSAVLDALAQAEEPLLYIAGDTLPAGSVILQTAEPGAVAYVAIIPVRNDGSDVSLDADGVQYAVLNSAATLLTAELEEGWYVLSTAALTADAPVQAAVYTYVLNTNTRVYHEPNCSSVKQMKEKNRQSWTGTLDELPVGYKPCGKCHP